VTPSVAQRGSTPAHSTGSRVAARDFQRPRRLSRERLRELALPLENLLPALEKRLSDSPGLALGLSLGELSESDAGTLFAGAAEPLCVLRFRVGKDPAWAVWEPLAAVGAVETLFGARGSIGTARKLSPSEAKVAQQLLGEITRAVCGALKLAPAELVLVQSASELGTWREGGETAQPHRLEVRLQLACGATTSTLCLYLPGIGAGEAVLAPLPAKLPAHLERVEVELSARLAGCEISLDQLLALEEGDVIPLEARVGDPTTLAVEGLTLAEARLGCHRGRLAVRVERLRVEPESLA